jgi:GNAT superfamily N-acetyltransferase
VSATSDGGVEIRTATTVDSAAIVAVWAANGDEIPAGGADIITPYLAHLMATGRLQVASDAGDVVGFAAVVERAGVTHLADLFVLPERFGEGIGGQLLVTIMGDATRRTTFASSDPRALPLYVRNGMTPWWPNLYLDIDSGRLPPPSPRISCDSVSPGAATELEELWLGTADADDHHFWASLPEARPFVVADAGRPVAFVHARSRRTGRDRWINRLVMAPESDPVAVIVAAYHHAAEGGRIGSCLPGPNPALPGLLAAGCRIIDRDTFMASDSWLFDATRRVSDGGIL